MVFNGSMWEEQDWSQFILSKVLPAIDGLGVEVGWGEGTDKYKAITVENNLASLFFSYLIFH